LNPSEPNWLGPYPGSELSRQDCEVLTVQNIPHKLLKEESALMQTKWFDYRRLHPMHATFYFLECYKDAYQGFIRAAVNAEAAPYSLPCATKEYKMVKSSKTGRMVKSNFVIREGLTFIDSRERLSFWKLRQLADRIGIRYDFFLNQAMKWYREQCFRSGKVHAPRPSHIATNEELLATVMLAWEGELETRLQIPKDPIFSTIKFVGSPLQLSYERFAIEQVGKYRHQRFSLSSLIYKHDAIRITEAIKHFGPDLVSDALGVYQFAKYSKSAVTIIKNVERL